MEDPEQCPVPSPPTLESGSSSNSGVISHLHNVSTVNSSLKGFRRLRLLKDVNYKGKERANGIGLAEGDEDELGLRERIAARIQRLRGDPKSEDDTEMEDQLNPFRELL